MKEYRKVTKKNEKIYTMTTLKKVCVIVLLSENISIRDKSTASDKEIIS